MSKNKDFDYYLQFVKLVNYSSQSALLLHDILKNFNVKQLEKKLIELHNIEHDADLGKHEMMQHLAVEFIAPIEREDIVMLAQNIDDITDSIEDVLITIHMYNITRMKPEVEKFTSVIASCCQALQTAMKELPNFKKSTTLSDKLIEVNRLEETCDSLYYDTVHQLFLNTTAPIDLFIWSDIYAKLEHCTDACEHVADIIESVVMKNS